MFEMEPSASMNDAGSRTLHPETASPKDQHPATTEMIQTETGQMSEGREYTKFEIDADASLNNDQDERDPMRQKVYAADRRQY